jgi:hypothetical protein
MPQIKSEDVIMPASVESIPIDITFKGGRPYLRGADIFTVLVRQTGVERDISLKFTSMLSAPIEAISASDVADPEASPARFRGHASDGLVDLVVRYSSDNSEIVREAFDEDALAEVVRFLSTAFRFR